MWVWALLASGGGRVGDGGGVSWLRSSALAQPARDIDEGQASRMIYTFKSKIRFVSVFKWAMILKFLSGR